jgi:hypothetical protein
MSSGKMHILSSLACVSLIAARAEAEPSRPALHWSRAANASECVDPRTLAELVETYTGPVLVGAAGADLSIEGQIERESESAFRVRISVTQARGRPTGDRVLQLSAADCRALDGAIALVIATTIDPGLGADALPAELAWLQNAETSPTDALRAELVLQPSAVEPAASPPASTPTPQPQPAPTRESPQPAVESDWELGLAVSYGSGMANVPSMGGLLTVLRRLGPWFSLGTQLRGHAGLSEFEVDLERSITGQAFSGAIVGCAGSGLAAGFGALACLGPELGWFSAHGHGFHQPHTIYQPSYGAVTRLELRYALGDELSISAAGLLALDVTRNRVWYSDIGNLREAFASELFTLHAALGLTHEF